jgi:hypothetical protein
MAELHKFQDDAKTAEKRVQPIGARHLDENFKMVWLDLSDSLKSFLTLTESPGVRPVLDFVTQPPSAESVPVFSGGQFMEWRETEECE